MKIKMIHKNKLSPLGQATQDILSENADREYFGTRKALNEELLEHIQGKDFKEKIKSIRRKLSIPRIKFEDDVIEFFWKDDVEVESRWLLAQDESVKNKVDIEVKKALEIGLPIGFYNWVQHYILYGKKPKWMPLYNLNIANDIINYPEELNRIPLTSQEKKYIRKSAKSRLGIKGRPSKRHQEAYSELLQALSRSKNKKRRFRTLKTALKTQELGKTRTVYDSFSNEYVSTKVNSKDLATIIFNDETGRKSQNVRKQKERLIKRKEMMVKK